MTSAMHFRAGRLPFYNTILDSFSVSGIPELLFPMEDQLGVLKVLSPPLKVKSLLYTNGFQVSWEWVKGINQSVKINTFLRTPEEGVSHPCLHYLKEYQSDKLFCFQLKLCHYASECCLCCGVHLCFES